MENYTQTTLNKVTRGAKRATYDVTTINAILDRHFIGFVAYTYESQALCIPMAYGRIDNTVYLHGSLKNRMLLALLENNTASMTVMHLDGLVLARSAFHHSVNYRSATLFGTVTKVTNYEEKNAALKCIVNHMVPDRWDSLRPMSDKEFNATLVVALNIKTASAKVRAEGVIDEAKDLSLPVWAGIVPLRDIAEAPINDAHLDDTIEIPEHVLAYCREKR